MKYDCRVSKKGIQIDFSGTSEDLFTITLMILVNLLSEDEFYKMCHNLGCVTPDTELYNEIKGR